MPLRLQVTSGVTRAYKMAVMDKHHHFVRMLKINASWMNQLVLAAAFSMFFTFPSL